MLPDDLNPDVSVEKIEGIPLYLIPRTIADQIRNKGESVFQINVERKRYHSYTVKVETFDEHADRVKQDEASRNEGDGH